MRTGPFTLWEMKKYIKKHSNVISEGIWPFQKGLSPMSDLKPQPISLKVKQFLPHVAAELELPTPLSPKVEKSLLEILSRVSPEPFGTGGTLRLSLGQLLKLFIKTTLMNVAVSARLLTPQIIEF
jgi:hypothetical protein